MTTEPARIVADERAADDRYRAALRRDEQNLPPAHRGYGSARRMLSREQLNPIPPSRGLIGRVELDEPDDVCGGDFYIGSRYYEGNGIRAYSWAAPIAATFFQSGRHPLCDRVTAVRTLHRRRGEITSVTDDEGPAPRTKAPFSARALAMPAAPTRRALPVPAAAPAVVTPPPARPEPQEAKPGRVLRAARAVLAAIKAPRRERLSSVLATLQPDQYDLVSLDPRRPVVVEGPPGTGKTVIATHRAAYLVAPENKRTPVKQVLLVGPTAHYVTHVRGVLQELVADPAAVEVMALDDVLLDARGVSWPIDDGRSRSFREVDDDLGQLAERAAHLLRKTGRIAARTAHAAGVEQVYEALRANRVGDYRIATDADWVEFLRALPSFRSARSLRRFLPMLAACGLAVAQAGPYRFDHVIVDEAQDVTALEWAALRAVNPSGGWTLLGDMNQRRSDLSCHDWEQVTELLDVPLTRETLRRGYRTSAAIMTFAGRLLPRSERTVDSLQEWGETPVVRSVSQKTLYERVATDAIDMVQRHPDGTVAVIGFATRDTARALRRAGCTIDGQDDSTMWWKGRPIRVLDPQHARGLEFDAVIVVEPGAFPSRLGRHGLLYTSLTRANKQLIVLHSQRLPEQLRVRNSGPKKIVPPNSAPAPAIPQQRTEEPAALAPEFRTAAG